MSLSASDQPPLVVPAPVNPAEEIDAVLSRMMDRLFVLVATLGVATFAVNSARVVFRGYNPSFAGDVVAFGVVLGVLALRKRLPIRLVFGVVVGAIVMMGLVSLATLGLASAGMMLLTTGCILVGVFASLRTAVITAVIVFVVVALIGLLYASAVLPPLPNVAGFIAAPSSWATQTAALLVCVLAVVLAATGVRLRLTRSLEELGQRGAELARVAEQLRESERLYRLLADNITDVVFVQRLDLSLLYLSQSAEQLFGRSLDELFRLGMAGVMTPESLHRAQEAYQQYLPRAQRGEPVEAPLLEFEYLRADGSTFWGELRVRFLRDANGALLGSQGVLRDISDRRRSEQERLALKERLREAEKLQAVGQLAGGVAHDFNNQLSAIMGFADLVRGDAGSSASTRSHAGNILLAARRSAELTSKLLAFARRTQQRSVAVDLHVIIGEVVAMLERTVDRSIRIETRLAAPRSVILGDPSQLVSALLNLGLNARDAMPQGGSLLFVTAVAPADGADSTDDGFLEVRVEDTGTGMDPETIRHAFEPFFTLKDVGRGTGLGLAAVYGTVRSHGGSIDIDSSPGSGTTFRLRFPLHDALPQEASAPAEVALGRIRRSATVMVVDDEDLVGRATGLALERAGHRVQLFTSPTAALRHYREGWREIDLVVIDMIMPEMTGQELFAELHATNRDVAVVITSGHVPATAVKQLLELGAREFLAKPFTPSELVASVERALGAASLPLPGRE
jgi:two-component system cell cycle sensor histidine kinase/response regulator CckA